MNYSIYQLKRNNSLRFMNYEYTQMHGGVKISDYETVYTGEIAESERVEETLERIFVLFNTQHPDGYIGRSVSTSDLVVLEDTGTYFCDSIGWKKIN